MEGHGIQNRVLCLVRDTNSSLVLGRGTDQKEKEERGLLTGPGGFVLPNFVAEQEIKRYCWSDLRITPDSFRKVAEFHYDRRSKGLDTVLYAYEVRYSGGLPHDTVRLTGVGWHFLGKLPNKEMPSWSNCVTAALGRIGAPSLFRFVRDGQTDTLVTVNELATATSPA